MRDISKVLAASGIVILSVIFGYWISKKKSKERQPKKWKCVGKLKEIYYYPIKSGAAVTRSKIECTTYGIQDGARMKNKIFGVTNEQYKLISAKNHPKVVLIEGHYDETDDAVILSAPEMTLTFKIAFGDIFEKCTKITIKKSKHFAIDAYDLGDEVAEWISQYLLNQRNGLRFILYADTETNRNIFMQSNVSENWMEDFCAITNFLVLSESAVNKLNAKLEVKVSPLQFRPNFIITQNREENDDGFDENKCKWLRIGHNGVDEDVIFQYTRPCDRCTFVNIDPFTGVRNMDNIPLKIIRLYSEFERNLPVMGAIFAIRQPGTVQIGDNVYVEDG